MMIDADVRAVAHDFGLDPALLQAVVTAEGNILKAVQCSIPTVQTRSEALRILARSAAHAMTDYIKSSDQYRAEFVAFWGDRWAPVGAANDPKGLNANWIQNVRKLWAAGAEGMRA